MSCDLSGTPWLEGVPTIPQPPSDTTLLTFCQLRAHRVIPVTAVTGLPAARRRIDERGGVASVRVARVDRQIG